MEQNDSDISSIHNSQRKFRFIPQPVITKNHTWQLDEYLWFCVECEIKITDIKEIRSRVFGKAFPILVSGNNFEYLTPSENSLGKLMVTVNCHECGTTTEIELEKFNHHTKQQLIVLGESCMNG